MASSQEAVSILRCQAIVALPIGAYFVKATIHHVAYEGTKAAYAASAATNQAMQWLSQYLSWDFHPRFCGYEWRPRRCATSVAAVRRTVLLMMGSWL